MGQIAGRGMYGMVERVRLPLPHEVGADKVLDPVCLLASASRSHSIVDLTYLTASSG